MNNSFLEGSKGILKSKNNPKSMFTLSKVEVHQSFEYIVNIPGSKMKIDHILENFNNKTKFSHIVEFVGPLSIIWGLLLGNKYSKQLPLAMQNLKNLLEK